MILRIRAQEEVPLQMDEYVRKMYPRAYQLAEKLCKALEEKLCLPISSAEVTLLAIHISACSTDRYLTKEWAHRYNVWRLMLMKINIAESNADIMQEIPFARRLPSAIGAVADDWPAFIGTSDG